MADRDSSAIDRFIAERGVTPCPVGRGTRRAQPMPASPPPQRRGYQARRLGSRFSNGHIKPLDNIRWQADRGHEMTMLHRAEGVDPKGADKMREAIERRRNADLPMPTSGPLRIERVEAQQQVVRSAEASRRAGDPKSTYVIGRLFLAGLLTDPDDADRAICRHNTAFEFALMHFRLFGPATAPSHLRNAIAGMGMPPSPNGGDDGLAKLAARYGRWCAAAMTTPPRGRILAHQVLERAALYEMAPDNPADEATLRRVLDALARVRG
jgi:hypothetical protein